MAGEIQPRATLARPFLPTSSTAQVAYLLLEMRPTDIVAHVRMPVNVSFVLDRSGSMKIDGKMDRVRRATATAIDMLDEQDTISVISFDHRAEVLIGATSVRNREQLKSLIHGLRDAGGTRIAPAIEKALQEIQKERHCRIRRLLLLTDGQTEHEKDCLQRAAEAGEIGIPITALGVGRDWNEDLLIEMANRSGGTADYIDRPEKIVDFFQTTVHQAQASVIQNAALTLRLVQGVTPRAVWQVIPLIDNLGYRPLSERDVSVPLGELASGEGRTLLIELLVQPRPIGQYRIGQAEIVYDVPALNLVQERVRVDILMGFADDPGLLHQVNATVMNTVEKISAFKLQTRALKDIEVGDISSATQKLQSAVTRLLSQGEVELAQTMEQEISNLQQSGQLSSEGQKTIKFATRKTVRLSDLDPGSSS